MYLEIETNVIANLKRIFWPSPGEAVERSLNASKIRQLDFSSKFLSGVARVLSEPTSPWPDGNLEDLWFTAMSRMRNDFMDPYWEPPEFNWGYSRATQLYNDMLTHGFSVVECTSSGLRRRVDPAALRPAN